ncbi:hypothetical protein [Halorubrum sp. CSM-61]|uniref:hypothetical protein n=1 Tax=Halorubrum sp. CSM-61 TaxID=2485838 RepID=UPI000F4BEF16|nr:hypothetical protein [Halorubrum sp. CSM-61]
MQVSSDSVDIQARDDGSIDDTVEGLLREKRRKRQQKEDLNVEAEVRDHLTIAKEVLAEDSEAASEVLGELHELLWEDDDVEVVIDRRESLLEDNTELSAREATSIRSQFRRHTRLRETGNRSPDPETEYKVLLNVAKALNYYSSVTEMTPYAPVTMETIDEPGSEKTENPTPVGRRRLKAATSLSTEDAAVEIPHQSCDHILCVALPRSGKDSTLASIGMNLWNEHGYKYISIFDDGRMETPMISIPNDDPGIRSNLDRLDQDPKAFDSEVFVPAMQGVPDTLPNNFREFTIGVDSLTPHLILRLSGVNTSDETAEDRIEQALQETLENSGGIPELVGRIQEKAGNQNATIEWTEQAQNGSQETYTAHYEMERSKALNKAAARLSKLAGDGLIASAAAETNISMRDVVANQEQAAVLCCNFIADGQESIKYTIIDLWLRLVYKVRDEYPRLPRVALEIRELKDIAPSKLGDARYKEQVKSLRQTLFTLSTRGGSRRILLLGSTQKLNDVYKPVRSNMATKILLRLGEEGIETLDNSYHFGHEQKRQLSEFSVGWGMLIAGGEKKWPIEWRGAPCGLGLGDQHWLDRFGTARGARVRQSESDRWTDRHAGEDWWVHVPDASVHPGDTSPEIGDTYSEWYLLESDFPDEMEPDDVDAEAVEEALAERREYNTPSDIALSETLSSDKRRRLSMRSADGDGSENVEAVLDRHGLPPELRRWVITKAGEIRKAPTRQKLAEAVHVIGSYDDLHTYSDIGEHLSYSASTFANYISEEDTPLSPCVTKDGKAYVLTEVGKAALDADWDVIIEAIQD